MLQDTALLDILQEQFSKLYTCLCQHLNVKKRISTLKSNSHMYMLPLRVHYILLLLFFHRATFQACVGLLKT